MGKFRVRLKVQGLEVEIDGERPDLPAITGAVSQQLSGLILPAAVLTGAETPTETIIEGEVEGGKSKPKPARKPRSGSRSFGESSGQPIEFRHEPAKYGNPLQSWNYTQKAVWLLAVLKGILDTKEASTSQLAATFNDQFKQAGVVRPPNLARYLGEAKVQNPSPIGEHNGVWFLTQEGERMAKELIQSVLNPTA